MGVLTLAIILLFYVRLLSRTITYDEAYTFNQYSSQGFVRSLLAYTTPNNHILHTLLVWVSTTLLGSSTTAIRLPAFISAFLSLGIFYSMAKRLGCPRTGVLAVALLAAQPAFIEYAVSARGYSLSMALTLLVVSLPLQSVSRRHNYALLTLSAALILTLPSMILFLGVLILFSRSKSPIVVGALIGLVPYGPALMMGVVANFGQYGLSGSDLFHQSMALYSSLATWIVLIGALAYSRQAYNLPLVRLTLYAIGVGVTAQIIMALFSRALPPRTLLYLLPLCTLWAALYIDQKLKAYAVALIVPFLILTGINAHPKTTKVDQALTYIRAQPSTTTVVVGCCVNEAVKYHLKDDIRLWIRPQTSRVLILLDFDDLEKVLDVYPLDEVVGSCHYVENYHELTILECEFQRPSAPIPVS